MQEKNKEKNWKFFNERLSFWFVLFLFKLDKIWENFFKIAISNLPLRKMYEFQHYNADLPQIITSFKGKKKRK